MNVIKSPEMDAKLILRGINLSLTDAMRSSIASKVDRLLRHESRIVRVRIDVENGSHRGVPMFTAKGHIEIGGPDLVASVETEDAYKSIDFLIDKLDRALRKRVTAITSRRHGDDIRTHEREIVDRE
jgi:putative sigma-54 modulation protein